MRSPAKGVSGLKLGSRVQIPPSPPFFFNKFINNASVAQLDRASDYGSEGYGFNSCQVRHFIKIQYLHSLKRFKNTFGDKFKTLHFLTKR